MGRRYILNADATPKTPKQIRRKDFLTFNLRGSRDEQDDAGERVARHMLLKGLTRCDRSVSDSWFLGSPTPHLSSNHERASFSLAVPGPLVGGRVFCFSIYISFVVDRQA